MNAILSIKPEYVAEIKAGRKRFEPEFDFEWLPENPDREKQQP